MTKINTIKVGIIGGGFGYYGHYKAFQEIDSCKVIAIATRKKISISKNVKIYSDPKKLITSENLDIISVATSLVLYAALYSISKINPGKPLKFNGPKFKGISGQNQAVTLYVAPFFKLAIFKIFAVALKHK